MRGAKTKFSAEALEYLAEHARQDEVLARVERETAEMPRSGMQITPDQGALLTVLAQLMRATAALELGTFTGYSAICIARGLAPGGKLTCLELEQRFADIAQRNLQDAGVADRARIEVGPANAWLERQPAEPRFDFVFLDADKSGYPAYYELLLPRMKANGLLLIDNTLMDGEVVDPQDDATRAVAELNDAIAADERVDAAMALVADGLTFVRKR
ncbi:MAG: caffeoyl-CoA O-methyltransferase [Solirubrobacteraceae bacterium]|jgi:caffeoyl-CoA O-methyltransferase|nr:caffeoyl-CoA O-methyltransferase [Solirubrobacteraceae bacterium]